MQLTESAVPLVLTVDVEDFFEPRPPSDTYRGVYGGCAYGVPLIMKLVEDRGGRATFFVDVYNRRTVDAALIADVCREIAERGHEVALHTHPAFPSGRRGYGMAQTMMHLTLAEQTRVVEEGAALIDEWTGARPQSHRAGGYGANLDTLSALRSAGIGIDSSALYGYPLCPLNEHLVGANQPMMLEGILEIPVSVTRCTLTLGAARRSPRLLSLVKKIDPDWCSPGEMRRQLDTLVETGLKPILLFAHSYTFLDVERGFVPNHRQIDSFARLLDDQMRDGARSLVTLANAAPAAASTALDSMEGLPEVPSDILWRDRELTTWLLRKGRLRHLRIILERMFH